MTTTDHRAALTAFEDAEQAHALQWPPVTLYYDYLGWVLAGRFKGWDAFRVADSIITDYRLAGWDVSERRITLRPWWRLWRPTRAIRITVRASGGFEQDFDDGGHA